MKIENVTTRIDTTNYIAEDGTIFKSEFDCSTYEKKLKNITIKKKILKDTKLKWFDVDVFDNTINVVYANSQDELEAILSDCDGKIDPMLTDGIIKYPSWICYCWICYGYDYGYWKICSFTHFQNEIQHIVNYIDNTKIRGIINNKKE